MQIIVCDDWADFRSSMSRYSRLDRARRDEFWFRGQGDSRMALEPTLDRTIDPASDEQRERLNQQLLSEFRHEAIRLHLDQQFTSDIDKLELMARHHGLPSPLLDWTLSPFVAAYFAFADRCPGADHVSIWMIDLAALDLSGSGFDLISDITKIENNPRALRQKGVFLRIMTIQQRVEELLAPGLYRFDISTGEKDKALAELDEMMVNGTYLYYNLDGAAQTARHRIGAEHGSR